MTRAPFTCGLEAALVVIGGKWKPLILFHLGPDKRRFGELRRLVAGVSEKMLIQQLRELQADGIIERVDTRRSPRRSNTRSRRSDGAWPRRSCRSVSGAARTRPPLKRSAVAAQPEAEAGSATQQRAGLAGMRGWGTRTRT